MWLVNVFCSFVLQSWRRVLPVWSPIVFRPKKASGSGCKRARGWCTRIPSLTSLSAPIVRWCESLADSTALVSANKYIRSTTYCCVTSIKHSEEKMVGVKGKSSDRHHIYILQEKSVKLWKFLSTLACASVAWSVGKWIVFSEQQRKYLTLLLIVGWIWY